MLVVLGFLLRIIDVSVWFATLGPLRTLALMLKASPKVLVNAFSRPMCWCAREFAQLVYLP